VVIFGRQGDAQEQRLRARALVLAVLFSAISAWAATAPKPKPAAVTIEAVQFSPATLEVQSGDTVTWTNKDPFPHNVMAQDKSFHSGDMPSGRTWKFKAGKKGTFPYVCTLHPTMKAELVVK
jgi:plastocyanin